MNDTNVDDFSQDGYTVNWREATFSGKIPNDVPRLRFSHEVRLKNKRNKEE